MNKSVTPVLVCSALAGLGALVLWAWLAQPVTNQELLANYAKARDLWAGAWSVGGLPWWSPTFLQGTSLAFSWSVAVTNAVLLAFSIPLGFLAGPKVAAVVLVAFGALGVFAFLRRYTSDVACACAGAFLFLISPSLLTRLADFEHFVVISSISLLPWAFYGLLVFLRSPSPATAVGSALTFAAVVLAYGKTGVMALPVMILFALSEFSRPGRGPLPSLRFFLIAAGAFFLLAVVPNFPALRETRFVALFEFGPFEGWQRAFSTKSALGWIDRDGFFASGAGSLYAPTTGNGGTYLGLTVFAAFVVAFFRNVLHGSDLGRSARVFLTLALVTFWLSFGPESVVGGHFVFLSLSFGVPDFSPALAWFLLAAQVWIIFRLVPPGWPFHAAIAGTISAVYLLVPGFRLLEWLPLYKNIRAPFDFFQITGAVCIVIAAAIVVRILISQIPRPVVRSAFVAALVLLAALDSSTYARRLFSPAMEREVFTDFLATQDYLNSSALAGRVYPFSGRYFYLLTPMLTGRPLVSEAFNNYLQQRSVAMLQALAFTSEDNLARYLNIAGISHVLIDKTDPDTSPEIRTRFEKFLPVVFENTNFAILENKSSLGDGFVAPDFLQATAADIAVANAALEGAGFRFATIEMTGSATDAPGLRGRIVEGRIEAATPGSLERESEFSNLSPAPGASYQEVTFEPAVTPGWLVFNQAWHPDWKAFRGSEPVPVRRAFVGFSAVRAAAGDSITFRFAPPWWYTASIVVSAISWLAAIGFLMLAEARSRSQAPSREGSP